MQLFYCACMFPGENLGQIYEPSVRLRIAQGTPSLEELKLMYYRLLIRYHEHNNSYIDICRCYRSIYEVAMHSLLPVENF